MAGVPVEPERCWPALESTGEKWGIAVEIAVKKAADTGYTEPVAEALEDFVVETAGAVVWGRPETECIVAVVVAELGSIAVVLPAPVMEKAVTVATQNWGKPMYSLSY